MDIKVDYCVVHPSDPLLVRTYRGVEVQLPGRYLPLPSRCYALLSPESDIDGIVADLWKEIVVLHCSETRRTVVASFGPGVWPEGKDHPLESYASLFDYLLAGRSQLKIPIAHIEPHQPHDPAFLTLDPPVPFKLGASPTLALVFEFLREEKGCNLDYRIVPDKDSFGCSISKLDAHLTLYRPSPGAPIPLPFILEQRFLFWDKRSMVEFVNKKGGSHFWRFYDGRKVEERLPPLSSAAKDSLKHYHDEGATSTEAEQAARFLKQQLGIPAPFDVNQAITGDLKRPTATALLDLGPYCTVCGSQDHLRRCSGCMMDAYCSAEHQRQDWTTHKDWCKKNRKTTSS